MGGFLFHSDQFKFDAFFTQNINYQVSPHFQPRVLFPVLSLAVVVVAVVAAPARWMRGYLNPRLEKKSMLEEHCFDWFKDSDNNCTNLATFFTVTLQRQTK